MKKEKGYWIKIVALSFITVTVAAFSVSFADQGVFKGETGEAVSSPTLNLFHVQEKSPGIEMDSALPKIGISSLKEEGYRVSQLEGERSDRPSRRYQPRPTAPTPPSPSTAPSAPVGPSGLLTTQTPLPTPPPSSTLPVPQAPSPSTPAATPSPLPSLPPAPSPPGGRPQELPKGAGFIFNFDNADLYEVIRVMAEVMKLSYLIDPKVKGVVNIHTTGQISSEDIFPVFQTILHLNGATAVQKGSLYEIVPFGDAKKLYTIPSRMEDAAKTLTEERYVILIVPLKYVPVTEASKMIKPFLSDGADIIEHPSQNILLIGDIASNIRKVVDLLALFDIDLFTDLKVRIYPVFNSDVNDIAKEMERIFASFEVSTKSGRGVGITFTPVTRINALLVVSSIPNIFDKVERWLKQLDQTPADEAKLGVFVYYVQNGKAKDLADVVKQIFTPPKDKKPATSTTTPTSTTPSTPAPAPRGVRPIPTPPAPGVPSPTPGEEGGIPTGEITIVVDETTNALIIRSFPRDYKFILETIKKLDLYPKQVLIEVFLAEISLDDSNKFGLEWSTTQGSFNKGGTKYDWIFSMGGLAPDPTMTTGIRYAIAATDKLAAAVNAQAVENRAKIISSPHLIASNNKEAKIQIGKSQPILTSTYTTSGLGNTTGVVEGTIEYKDVGIIITVTPRISDSALVTMDVSIEDSTVETTKLGTLDNVPVFKKKTAKTTLSIMEAQTVVIGGLIEESGGTKKSGVPLLSKIPLLGALFGYHEYSKARTELMLLLTPHVITDIYQSNAVTREFKDKIDSIRKELDKKLK